MTTKVSSAMQDLSDNYAFTGTVSGAGKVVQVVNVTDGAVATGTTQFKSDDTIPQNNEGNQFMTLAITPTNSLNMLRIDIVAFLGNANTGNWMQGALFQDSTANALAAMTAGLIHSANVGYCINFSHWMVAGTTSATTMKFRGGGHGSTNTATFNGTSGARKYGGKMASSITITEIAV